MADDTSKKRSIAKTILILIAVVLVIGLGVFWWYVSDYYHADEYAEEMLTTSPASDVVVEHLEGGSYAFVPQDPIAGIIFYPGAKVDANAYTPLMRDCAGKGLLCVVASMPLHFAILDIDAASRYEEMFPKIKNWYLAGHSLGGASAAMYADANDDKVDGIILLGAYSTKDLKDNNIDALSIYGSEDQVLNKDSYADNWSNLPADTEELVIQGGNHAGFGNYGPQDGDGDATIPSEWQQQETADAIYQFISNNLQELD